MPGSDDNTGRRPLTRERVLHAAITLADEHGIDRLSMRKLAGAVGVEAMSLYNHVKNKDDLIDGICDVVVGEIAPPPSTAPWKEAMRERALSTYAMLRRHPWATTLIGSRVLVGPNTLGLVEATLACLRSAGFSYPLADHAWNALDSYVYGFTMKQQSFPFEQADYADTAASYVDEIPEAVFPHLRALTIEVMERRHSGIHDLRFGLDLLLDGLERLRDSGRSAPGTPGPSSS